MFSHRSPINTQTASGSAVAQLFHSRFEPGFTGTDWHGHLARGVGGWDSSAALPCSVCGETLKRCAVSMRGAEGDHIFVHQRAGECGPIRRKRRTSHVLGGGGMGEGDVACERVRTESSDTVDACHLGFSAVKLNWHKEPRAALSEIQRWTLHNGWVTLHLFLWLWGVCECLGASISLRAGRHFFPEDAPVTSRRPD